MKEFCLVIIALLFFYSAEAERYIVGPNERFTSISKAIEKSRSSDTIIIQKGEYFEPNLLIEHPLNIIGIDYPIIENRGNKEIFTIESDSVIIKGLQLQNVAVSFIKDYAAIKVNKQKYCVFEDNRLKATFFGIFLKNSQNCIIKNNFIKGVAQDEMSSGNAIHLWYCRNILVEENETRNHRDGIYLEFVDNSIVKRNLVVDNIRYGLHFMFSDHDEYIENKFKSNGAGVAVMFSKFIKMYKNVFENNWGSASYGLLLKDITDSEIKRNIFQKNTIGIYMDGANRVSIYENDFKQNGWALKIYGSSSDNNFYHNNFLNNSFELSIAGNARTNKFDGNFWSLYTGYDLDKDGTGDVPYRPVKLFSRIIGRIPSSSILMRSMLIDVINFAEKISPVLTPDYLKDNKPLIKEIIYD